MSEFQKYTPIPGVPEDDVVEKVSSSTHCIPSRPSHIRTFRGNRAPRPSSIGAIIISNPKLVKGWQYYDNDSSQSDIRRYLSTVNLPPAWGEFCVESNNMDSEDERGDNVEIKACVMEETSAATCTKFGGILLTLVASGALALSVVIAKMKIPEYDPILVSLWTFQGIFLPSMVILLVSCIIKRKNVIRLCPKSKDYTDSGGNQSRCKSVTFILTRALLGWLTIVLKCYSLRFMSADDSTIIGFTAPVFVVIAGYFCLREKFGIVPILTAFVMLVAIGIILRPPLLTGQQLFDNNQLTGTLLAVGSMLMGVFIVIILRHIRHVHFAFINFILGLVGTGGSLLLCAYLNTFELPKNKTDWMLAACLAGLTFIGQSLLTLALKYEQAGTFSLVRTTEIVFIFGWQAVVLHQYPDVISLIGGSIVILGVLIITVRKWVHMQSHSHASRKWCGVILK